MIAIALNFDHVRSSGPGFLFLLDLTADNQLNLVVQTQWTDGLFDLAFAEDHPDIILTASGDGGIQLWDLKTPEVYIYQMLIF